MVDWIGCEGKTAIVTGAGRGLGRASAIRLAQAGVNTVLTDIRSDTVEMVCEEVEALGPRAIPVAGDVSAKGDVENVVRSALSEFGKIDILINNAGICPIIKYYDVTESDWDRIVDINLKGLFLYCQAVAPLMSEHKSGAIVNVSSMGAWTGGLVSSAPYVASKSGVIGITRHFARYLAPDGVRVNTVAPGAIETDFGGGAVRDDQQLNSFIASQTALGRVGLPDDIGAMIASLLSDDNKWVNAQRIEVSGGMLV